MTTRALLARIAICAVASSAASAQIVSPVPAAPPAKVPDYQPPALPPPPSPGTPAQPQTRATAPEPEPDLPPIDLVKKDADDKVILLTVPASEAAMEAMILNIKSEETKAKLHKLMEDRRAAVENAVAKNAKAVLEAREKLAVIDTINGWDPLSSINTALQPAFVNPPLVDMATAQKLLTRKEADRVKKAETDYRKAATKVDEANVDLIIRLNVKMNLIEPMRSADDLLGRAAEKWGELRDQIGVTDAQKAAVNEAEGRVRAAVSPSARMDAMAALLKNLSEQQQSAALLAVAKPMPIDLQVAPPTQPKPRQPAPKPASSKPTDGPKPAGK